ncbi:MAG: HAMP domain-containing protein, partial [Desulfobacteraceae bacterium]|nr:HAMP domain-containing protein [Desulfobacteraceae bacterium]
MSQLFQFFRNLKIRSKLLGGYTLIFVLATLAGGAVIYHQVRTTIEANIESELTNATATIQNMVHTAAATSIKNHLKAIAVKNREIVQEIHNDFLLGRTTEEDAKALCRKILFSQSIGKTGYIFCANSRGIAIEHPNPGVAGKNFSTRPFVHEMIKMKTGYLEYDWKNPEDEKLKPKAMYMSYFEPWDWIIAASTYREEFKELINISDFRESILSLTFGKTGYAYINDSLGNLIVHPFMTGNYFDVQDREGRYFVRDICEKKNGKTVYTWKNPGETIARGKMVIFKYIPEYDWIVASASYLDEIYAPLKTVGNIIFSIVFLTCVLVFSTSLWINTTVIRPLQTLMNRFAMGASGDFNIRMPVESTDEIGQLADYFNKFMDRLNRHVSEQKKSEQALRLLERQILTISERERQKIAMDLHDDLCPQLIGIEVMTKMLQQRLREKAATDTLTSEFANQITSETDRAGKIRTLILDAIEKTRGLSRGLSPVNLTDRGFDASLTELTAYVREVFHIDCTLSCDTVQ